MRLRTLPLSLGGVLCGGLVGVMTTNRHDPTYNAILVGFIALTACCLQVLSNLSNELGDYHNGVDKASERKGPAYGMLEGGLSELQMKKAIRTFAILSAIFGLIMILWAFNAEIKTLFGDMPREQTTFYTKGWGYSVLGLLLLGAAAIWAAMHYTLGKNPYGYRGLGDIFVFIFFGLASVLGSYFLVTHNLRFPLSVLLPAVGMGLLSVGVLNVNNIRDMETDRGIRITTPIRLGERAAKWYQTALVAIGIGCFFYSPIRPYPMLITLPFYAWHLAIVWRGHGRKLDPALPLLVLTTFVLSLLYIYTFAHSPIR